jgi:poly(A) polymerase
MEPFVLNSSEHNVVAKRISRNTLKVLARLTKAGYEGYLVGGGVRDLLLGDEPKDFDIATDARPEQIKELFRNSRIIGRRFRLVHLHFHQDVIEVATFRGKPQPQQAKSYDSGMIVHDNIYGSLEDDAWRRDFTVNALYYDYTDGSVLDFTGGLYDLAKGEIRLIGDVRRRYDEDPVRMLRAVRLSVKLNFDIDKQTRQPIPELAGLMQSVPPARRLHELNKLFFEGYAADLFPILRQYGLFAVMFPHTEAMFGKENGHYWLQFFHQSFKNTDERIEAGQPVHPGFLLAVLLWPPLQDHLEYLQATGLALFPALNLAIKKVTQQQRSHVSLPQRYVIMMREIWTLQYRLARGCNHKARKLVSHPRLRAAFDFLLLRERAGEPVTQIVDWWRRFMEAGRAERNAMIEGKKSKKKAKTKKVRSKHQSKSS